MVNKKVEPYLEGYKFTVVTDHSALRWLCNLKEPTGRLARWALQLQQWDFDIVHRRWTLHQVPDALSRAQEPDEVEIAGFGEIEDPCYFEDVTRSGEVSSEISAVESRGGPTVSTPIRPVAGPRGASRREVKIGRASAV